MVLSQRARSLLVIPEVRASELERARRAFDTIDCTKAVGFVASVERTDADVGGEGELFSVEKAVTAKSNFGL